jgi:hypothetical protein
MSAALQVLARALPGREVYLRAVAPILGASSFYVVIVDGRDDRYRVTLRGLPDPDQDEAVRLLAAELLKQHRNLLVDGDVRALEDLLAALSEVP